MDRGVGPGRGRRADQALRRRRASTTSCSTGPATTRSGSSPSSPRTCCRSCGRSREPGRPRPRGGGYCGVRVARGRHGTLDGDALPLIAEALNSADPAEVGAALVVSEGASFCTGGDVQAFAGAEDRGAYVARPRRGVPRHGDGRGDERGAGRRRRAGLGGGRGDVRGVRGGHRRGGPLHRLRPAYPGIGFSPDGGMSWTLPRLVGSGNARRILLTDEVLDAERRPRSGSSAWWSTTTPCSRRPSGWRSGSPTARRSRSGASRRCWPPRSTARSRSSSSPRNGRSRPAPRAPRARKDWRRSWRSGRRSSVS